MAQRPGKVNPPAGAASEGLQALKLGTSTVPRLAALNWPQRSWSPGQTSAKRFVKRAQARTGGARWVARARRAAQRARGQVSGRANGQARGGVLLPRCSAGVGDGRGRSPVTVSHLRVSQCCIGACPGGAAARPSVASARVLVAHLRASRCRIGACPTVAISYISIVRCDESAWSAAAALVVWR